MKLKEFVDARMAEPGSVPPAAAATYAALLALPRRIRRDAAGDDTWSWLTGAGSALVETVLGFDAESGAEQLIARVYAALALTWADHPDFDPAWRGLTDAG
ncbi:hypothetical protein [Naumannella huperziae]